MSKVILALTSAALLGLSGCADMHADKSAGQPASTSAKSAEPAKPAISAEAQAALSAAQAAAKEARAKNALWTTADAAIKAAEAAAAKGDSATVIAQSKLAMEHVKLGLAQLDYPMIKVGD